MKVIHPIMPASFIVFSWDEFCQLVTDISDKDKFLNWLFRRGVLDLGEAKKFNQQSLSNLLDIMYIECEEDLRVA